MNIIKYISACLEVFHAKQKCLRTKNIDDLIQLFGVSDFCFDCKYPINNYRSFSQNNKGCTIETRSILFNNCIMVHYWYTCFKNIIMIAYEGKSREIIFIDFSRCGIFINGVSPNCKSGLKSGLSGVCPYSENDNEARKANKDADNSP